MTLSVLSEAPPFRLESDGAIRIGDSRVLLEIALNAFNDGATPESIVQRFPSLPLSDVYSIIAYYLRHKPEVDVYVTEREACSQQTMAKIQRSQPDLGNIRTRLNASRKS